MEPSSWLLNSVPMKQNQGSLEKWPSSGLGGEGLGRAWSVLCRELKKGSKKDEDTFVRWKDMSSSSDGRGEGWAQPSSGGEGVGSLLEQAAATDTHTKTERG